LAIRIFRETVRALVAVAVICFSMAGMAKPEPRAERASDQFIVRFVPGSAAHGNSGVRQRLLDANGRRRGVSVSQLRRLAVGADVIHTSRKLDAVAAQAFMDQLRADPSVSYVEVDRMLHPAFAPNDPLYSKQWHYYEATGGINLPAAWDLSTGAGTVVAVLDTGITPHSDLNANIVAGYDFISSLTTAQDGNARDSDPNDVGDWAPADACGAGEPASNSSWHGTHVAGTVAAVTNNGVGVAGVAFNARVMPLRVLGRCGGAVSDIADAISWAAGGTVAGVPANGNPVEVINMSLGGAGACSNTTQLAINQAVAAGTVVVVAAGNDGADASGFEPANCQNVIVVGASNRSGAKASYSNYGAAVDVSAPGGDSGTGNGVASTYNNGTTTQGTETYVYFQGTSMAAPHVAGTVALMQSLRAASPSAVEGVLKSTARAFPVTCTMGCGAGIIDAAAAVGASGNGVLTVTDQSMAEGDSGTRNFTFTVNLSKPMPGTVTFNVSTADGSANAGSDYTALNLPNQSIAAGATSKTFTVVVNGDTSPEASENFFFNVSGVVGIGVADGQGVGTIVNDDPQPLANGVAVNGISGAAGESFLYSLVVPPGTTSLTFDTSGGSGDADLYVKFGSLPTTTSYDCKSESATTVENCTIAAIQAGTYYVLVQAYTSISGVSLTGRYAPTTSGGPPPQLSIGDVVVVEGNSGGQLATFTVSLSAPADAPVSFDVYTLDGTAIAGSDYAPLSLAGQVIPAGQSSKTVAVTVYGDTAMELNEYFYVRLANIAGASAPDRAQAMGVISNDDLPSLSISSTIVYEENSGANGAVFTIDLSRASTVPVSFNVSTSDGTASAGQDYEARSAAMVIPAGRTRATFVVQVYGDTAPEPTETFSVNLGNAVSASIGNGSGRATIVNDDGAAFASGRAAAASESAEPATSVPIR
jgi:serine protease